MHYRRSGREREVFWLTETTNLAKKSGVAIISIKGELELERPSKLEIVSLSDANDYSYLTTG